MGMPQPSPAFDFDAYLAWEEAQPDKHEYVRGEVFAMTGARREHVTVSLNLAAALKAHLRGGPCRVYMADMKLRIVAADLGLYPDVLVTCDPRDHAADLYMSHPVLVVEVLSETTAAYDRGDKFAAYRKLEGLREYLLVDIPARRLECFRRNAEGHWVLYEASGAEQCRLDSVDLDLPLAQVFEDLEAPGAGQ